MRVKAYGVRPPGAVLPNAAVELDLLVAVGFCVPRLSPRLARTWAGPFTLAGVPAWLDTAFTDYSYRDNPTAAVLYRLGARPGVTKRTPL